MAKYLLFIMLLAVALLAVKSQEATVATPTTTLSPEQVAVQFQNIALAAIEARVIKANLPDDLLQNGLDSVVTAQDGFENCKAALDVNHIIWQYRVCVAVHLKTAFGTIAALEAEAASRTTPAPEVA